MTTIVDKFEMNHRIEKLNRSTSSRLILSKVEGLKNKLKELNLDAFLVSNFYNIYYLSGFKTLTSNEREAWLLITKKNNYLFTDARYYENIKYQILNIKNSSQKSNILIAKLITPQKNLLQHLQEIIQQEQITKLGFEADDLKFNEHQKLTNTIKLIPTEKLIIKLREIKDDNEIEKIKKACRITDHCLSEIIKTIKVDQTEKEIAFKIEFWLKNNGYDLAFYPIVAIDENSALPHYDTKTNGYQKVKQSSVILIDFGAKYKDYLSDITRMIFVGKPTTEQLNIYNILLNAQQKTIKGLRKTNDPKKIDAFCRKLIADNRLLIYPHSTGHGLGLEIHEYPKISEKSTDAIQKNQVFTIEPGVYLPRKFGIRIEDTVWMKEDNKPEVLTHCLKNPIVIEF